MFLNIRGQGNLFAASIVNIQTRHLNEEDHFPCYQKLLYLNFSRNGASCTPIIAVSSQGERLFQAFPNARDLSHAYFHTARHVSANCKSQLSNETIQSSALRRSRANVQKRKKKNRTKDSSETNCSRKLWKFKYREFEDPRISTDLLHGFFSRHFIKLRTSSVVH